MRIINLDETGIKIIATNRKQMYLTVPEVREFINKQYKLTDNTLTFHDKSLILSEKDIKEFPGIYNYIKSHFE